MQTHCGPVRTGSNAHRADASDYGAGLSPELRPLQRISRRRKAHIADLVSRRSLIIFTLTSVRNMTLGLADYDRVCRVAAVACAARTTGQFQLHPCQYKWKRSCSMSGNFQFWVTYQCHQYESL